MSENIGRLSVVIDADKKPLEKSLDSAQKDVEKFSDNVEKSTENAKLSGLQGQLKKTIAQFKQIGGLIGKTISLDGQGYGMAGVKSDIAEATAGVKKYVKEAQLASGIKIYSGEYREQQNDLQMLNAEYDKLSQKMADMDEKGISTDRQRNAYEQLARQLRDVQSEITSTKDKMRELETAGADTEYVNTGISSGSYIESGMASIKMAGSQIKSTISEAVSVAKSQVQSFIKEISVIGRVVTEASYLAKKGFSGIKSVAAKAVPAIKKAGGAAASLIKKFASGIPIVRRFMNASSGSGSGSGGGLQMGFKNILKYAFGIRSLFVLINRLRSAMSAGLQNVAKSSSATQGSLNSLKNALNSLQNAAGAAAAPLVNALAPALTTIIGYVVDAINAVGMFIAALTGASTYTAAKFNKSTASAADGLSSTGGAAQDAKKDVDNLKRSLMGFDQINKLDDASSSGSGGSGGSGGSSGAGGFTTETVSTDAQNLADKVKAIWATIFDPMKEAWDAKGSAVISAWSSALQAVKSTVLDVGNTWLAVWSDGSGYETTYNILTMFELIGKAVEGVSTAYKKAFDDGNTGYNCIKSIFDAFNAILGLINEIGKALIDVWNNGSGEKAMSSTMKIFTDINNTITNISNNLKKAFTSDNMGKKIIQGVADIFNDMLSHINSITSGLKSWSSKLDFGPLTKSINNLVTALKPLGDKVGAGLEWLFTNVLQPLAKWAVESAIPAAIDAIAAALDAINAVIEVVKPPLKWLWDNFFKPLADWTGGVIVSVLETISKALEKISGIANTAGGWLQSLFGKNDTVDVNINGNIVSATDKTGGKTTIGTKGNVDSATDRTNGSTPVNAHGYLRHAYDKTNGKTDVSARAYFNRSAGVSQQRNWYPTISAYSYMNKTAKSGQQKNWYPTISAYAYIKGTTKSKKKEKGGSFYGGSWHSIPQFSGGGKLTARSLEHFAGGGAPTHGTAFVAGENGPEVVGHIGGRTEVLNASQLASTMYSAVLAAMTAAGNKSLVNVILQGDAKQFFRVMQQMAREYTAQTGKPAFE